MNLNISSDSRLVAGHCNVSSHFFCKNLCWQLLQRSQSCCARNPYPSGKLWYMEITRCRYL